MIILCLRTDTATARLSLYRNEQLTAEMSWEAGRALSSTLHANLQQLLTKAQLELDDIDAIAVYEGPGSFTGLRIGVSTANAFAYALNIPIVGVRGDNWIAQAIKKLSKDQLQVFIKPYYAAPAKTTQPRK